MKKAIFHWYCSRALNPLRVVDSWDRVRLVLSNHILRLPAIVKKHKYNTMRVFVGNLDKSFKSIQEFRSMQFVGSHM